MKKIILVIFLFILSINNNLYSASSELTLDYQQNWNKYSTKNHPKANGLNIEIKYPKNWKKQEVNEENIIQQFIDNYDNEITCMLSSSVLPETLTKEEFEFVIKNPYFVEKTKSVLLEIFSKIDNFTKISTKYNGLPGVYLEFNAEAEQAGIKIFTYNILHVFFYKNTRNDLWCFTSNILKYKAEKKFIKMYSTFRLIGNSIVLHNQYNNDTEIKENNHLEANIKNISNYTSIISNKKLLDKENQNMQTLIEQDTQNENFLNDTNYWAIRKNEIRKQLLDELSVNSMPFNNRAERRRQEKKLKEQGAIATAFEGLKDSLKVENIPVLGDILGAKNKARLNNINAKAYLDYNSLNYEEQLEFDKEVKDLIKQKVFSDSFAYKFGGYILNFVITILLYLLIFLIIRFIFKKEIFETITIIVIIFMLQILSTTLVNQKSDYDTLIDVINNIQITKNN